MENTYQRQPSGNVLLPSQGSSHKIPSARADQLVSLRPAGKHRPRVVHQPGARSGPSAGLVCGEATGAVHGAGECAATVGYVSVVECVYAFAPGQDAGATVAS